MNPDLHKSLMSTTENLRGLLSRYSTETIVGMCSVKFYHWLSSENEDFVLRSPLKQLLFLLGLMLSTPDPEAAQEFGDTEWNTCVRWLNDIFMSYGIMYWPSPEELPNLTAEWYKVREVAMPAFLHYFNTGLTASVDQISARMIRYIVPFDETLVVEFGISATECLRISRWIADSLQETADKIGDSVMAAEKVRKKLMARTEKEKWTLDKLKTEAQRPKYRLPFERMYEVLNDHMKVTFASLEAQFGSANAQVYWENFVCVRGTVDHFNYLTDYNLAEDKPLFKISEGVSYCPFANMLFAANLAIFEKRLMASSVRESFLRRRDQQLEMEIEEQFKSIFNENSTFYPKVYESADLHYEHDLIFIWRRNLFVIEAKASPPEEPFRDPERAFVRIKRAFQSDSGVQKAFDQAIRVWRKLKADGTISLYTAQGDLCAKWNIGDIDNFYAVCVTRDNFGPLAVDLSLLLEKAVADPFPWVINILDLDYMFNGWRYLNWGPEKLCEYLDVRLKLHGKIVSDDEIDLAGFFVQHAGLNQLLDLKANKIVLGTTYSEVFDKMFSAQKGGPPFILEITEPAIVNIDDHLAQIIPNSISKNL